MDRKHLLALALGAATTVVVAAIGFAVISAIPGGDGASSPSPSIGPSRVACNPVWHVVKSKDPAPKGDLLTDIAAEPRGSVLWAVGGSGRQDEPTADALVERWDGTRWNLVPSQSPGLDANQLNAVAVARKGDAWAVGETSDARPTTRTLVEHWDGTRWLVVPSPNGPDGTGVLYGAAALGPNDVWAVGGWGNVNHGKGRALALHWDGATWSSTDLPASVATGSLLWSIAADETGDVWAVGTAQERPLILRWDGATWTREHVGRSGYLHAVVPEAAGGLWGIGSPIRRWDGSSWEVSRHIGNAGTVLWGGTELGTDLWAVGFRTGTSEGAPNQPFTLRYDGTAWAQVPAPRTAQSGSLNAAVATGAVVWAVGFRDQVAARLTLVLRSECT